jgi:hypothetical protein
MNADGTNSGRQVIIQRPNAYLAFVRFNGAIRAPQQSRKHPHSLSI